MRAKEYTVLLRGGERGERGSDITLENFTAGKNYQIKLPKYNDAEGKTLHNQEFHYTAHNLPEK